MVRRTGRGRAVTGGEDLDLYQYACLAGGVLRVAESAVLVLVERGTLSLAAARLRVVGDRHCEHPVEEAVVTACPRSKPLRQVIDAVGRSAEAGDVVRSLVSLGLLGPRRHRPTRAGRRRLADAASTGAVPAFALHGAAALVRASTRSGPPGPRSVPDGLGRTLVRMGRALDDDRGHTTDGGSGGTDAGGGSGGGD